MKKEENGKWEREWRIGYMAAAVIAAFLCCLYVAAGASGRRAETAHAGTVGTAVSSPLADAEGAGKTGAEQLTLHAQSAVLMDADTGRVLYAKDAFTARPMASTTKIMTCILALEYGDPDDTVTVSSYAASQPKVHLGAPAGRSFRLGDLLYSLMLESHNDTAVMIAEHIGGSVGGFAELMNEKARMLGCTNIWFVTPNGLDGTSTDADGTERTHSTTARDLAAIMSYCVWQSPKREEFLKITGTQNYYFTDLEGKGSYSCSNHNALLNTDGGVISGKTGFTGGAGYCYVAALADGDRRYSLALLGCGWPPHKTYKWSDARKLFAYGTDHYEKTDVFREPELPVLLVNDGLPAGGDLAKAAELTLTCNLRDEEKSLPVLLKEGEKVEVRTELPDAVNAPVVQGTVVGQITYVLDGRVIRTDPVYAAQSVPKITVKWCMLHLLEYFLP